MVLLVIATDKMQLLVQVVVEEEQVEILGVEVGLVEMDRMVFV